MMKRYRLAIIRQKYRTDGGGERFISYSLMNALDDQSIELNIITREWKDNLPQGKWNVHICNPIIFSRISRERSFASTARTICKVQKFDIVQSHERIVGCDIYRVGDGVHRRWLIQRSKILPRWKRKMLMNSRYNRYLINIEKKMYQAEELKAIICNSDMVRKEITEDFDIDLKKIHLIYNSVDSNYFVQASCEQRAVLRKQLDLPINATIFCFVGSGFERKGLITAIKTIKNTPIYLIVIGKDKSKNRYLSLVHSLGYQKQIRFLGMQKEILPFYQLSDGLLLPSLYDPFPNVILEAMSCGLPVITSSSCGGAEIIEQGRNGFYCDALNIKELREAMMSIPPLYENKKMSTVSRNTIQKFTLEKLSRQMKSLYRKILK